MAISRWAIVSRIRCWSRAVFSSVRVWISRLAVRSIPIKRSRISGPSGLAHQLVGLVANQGSGRVGLDRDLAAGLVDRALHVLLPLLLQSAALVDLPRGGSAFGRRKPAVTRKTVALQIQVARLADDRRSGNRPGGRRGGTSGQGNRPVGLLGDVVLDGTGDEVAGIAGQGLAGQRIGMFQVAAMEVLEGQVVQSASAGLDLLPPWPGWRYRPRAASGRRRPSPDRPASPGRRCWRRASLRGCQRPASARRRRPSTSMFSWLAAVDLAVPTTTVSRSLRKGGSVLG